jgi:hypothetical protein
VLRQRVQRIRGHRDQPGERRGDDEGAAALHLRRERLDAEDDPVDVDAHDPPVVGERAVAKRQHARVQEDRVGRLDVAPRVRIGDVEAVGEVEAADDRALGLERRHERTADPARGARHERRLREQGRPSRSTGARR